MNIKIILSVFVFCNLLTSELFPQNKILEKTIEKLNSAEAIEYKVINHYLQKNNGTERIDTAICFFDFLSPDNILGAKYHFKAKHAEQIFDGNKIVSVNIREKRVLYDDQINIPKVMSSLFMINSIYVLKNVLPKLITDSSCKIERLDNVIVDNIENYNFKIVISDKYLDTRGDLIENKGTVSNYSLLISKDNNLPTQFSQIFTDNSGYWKTHYSDIKLEEYRPDSYWSFDKYHSKYKVMSFSEFTKSMELKAPTQTGQNASDWELPVVGKDEMIHLNALKGNLVLLEFWFPGCSGCVQAISELNLIQNNFSNDGLLVFGVEFSKSDDSGLHEYIQEHNIQYPVLYSGYKIARGYGVKGAPTFVLIDRSGKVLYFSVGFKKDELINSIKNNI